MRLAVVERFGRAVAVTAGGQLLLVGLRVGHELGAVAVKEAVDEARQDALDDLLAAVNRCVEVAVVPRHLDDKLFVMQMPQQVHHGRMSWAVVVMLDHVAPGGR